MSKREHELVPVHKIMSRSSANELLAKMGITQNNLPKIMQSDPQVKKVGAKPGDILEIEREEFGKKYTYYRVVSPES